MQDIHLSIVIPTHNRPELLVESITSALASSTKITEILVIDDASDPPVDTSQLEKIDSRIRIIRNNKSQGIARVRVQGADIAQGNWLYQLDDDDMLAPNALDDALEFMTSNGSDILFIGVSGFGKHAEHFNKVQTKAVERLLKTAGSKSYGKQLYTFTTPMSGLLQSVPSAFQHPLTTTKIWREINELRFEAYCKSGVIYPVQNRQDTMQALLNPFNESEWSLYAVSHFNIDFLNRPLYLARCEGERNYSVPGQLSQHLDAHSKIKQRLYHAAKKMSSLKKWQEDFKESYLDALFNIAYHAFYHESRSKAWRYLIKTIQIAPRFRYFRFFIRTFLPK